MYFTKIFDNWHACSIIWMDLFLSNVFFQTSPSQAKLYAFHDVITEGYMTSKFHEISRFVNVRTFYDLRFIETLDVLLFSKTSISNHCLYSVGANWEIRWDKQMEFFYNSTGWGECNQFPHLKNIAGKLMPIQNVEVGLLLGYDVGYASKPTEVLSP